MPGAVEGDERLLNDVLRPLDIADTPSDERVDERRHPRQQFLVGLPIASEPRSSSARVRAPGRGPPNSDSGIYEANAGQVTSRAGA